MATERLKLLHARDALVTFKNSLAIPKLLRTSECAKNPLLRKCDDTLRAALTTILNVNVSDDVASSFIGDGGLGIRSAQMLAPSAFWHQMHLHSCSNNPSFQTAFQH